MKNLLILAFVLIGFSSCSKHTITISENDLKDDIFYLKDQVKPFTGKCLVYYTGIHQIKESLTFKNGILNGEMISYYKCGSIKRKGYYKDGHLNGCWQCWDEKGQKIYKVNYKNDSLDGEATLWHDSGIAKEKGLYADNHKTGVWLDYNKAGTIISKKKF